MTNLELFSAVGGISGIIGLLGAAVGYGRLQQRLITVENDVNTVKGLAGQVARIDERTIITDRNVTDVKESVGKVQDSVTDLTRILIEDAAVRTRARAGRAR